MAKIVTHLMSKQGNPCFFLLFGQKLKFNFLIEWFCRVLASPPSPSTCNSNLIENLSVAFAYATFALSEIDIPNMQGENVI